MAESKAIKPTNIFQKMALITAEMQTVGKNLNVSTGSGKGYKAVSERDIIDAVKPIEAKYGVYSYPFDREIVESERLESVGYDGKTKTTFYTKLKTTYRFVNTEKPEEYIDIISYAVGLDSGDKGDGKAMTYADKYALMKAYKISTGDDPDQSASEDLKYASQKVSQTNIAALMARCMEKGKDINNLIAYYKVGKVEDLSIAQWNDAMRLLEGKK